MQLPSSRLDSPEVLGAGTNRFQFSIGSSAHKNATFTEDASYRPPDLSEPKFEVNNPLSGSFGWGIFENFELGLRTSVGPSPWRLIGKFQLLGDSREKAKQGNFSLAITGGIGYTVATNSGDQKGLLGPGGYKWNANVKTWTTEAALIAGYRVTDGVLLYSGGFYASYDINGRINHEKSDDGLSPEAEYEFKYGGYQSGANAGVRFEFGSRPTYLTLESVYSKATLAAGFEHEGVTFGAELGVAF